MSKQTSKTKKITILAVAFLMIFSVALLGACDIGGLSLEQRIDAAGQSAYAMQNGGNPSTQDIDALLAELAILRDEVARLQGENTALLARIDGYQAQLKALRNNNGGNPVGTFPSVLEDFDLAEFFEKNTLILVPFEWRYLLNEYLDFYTVFVEEGKINFLFEVTCPFGGGDLAVDMRTFAVIIPNAIFNRYEVGTSVIFETYAFSGEGMISLPDDNRTQNNREQLRTAEQNSIEHRVSLVPNNYLRNFTGIAVITSAENLGGYLHI